MKTPSPPGPAQLETFRVLVENLHDIISCHLPDSTITYVTPSSHEMLGYSPQDLVGRKSSDLVHPDDMEHTLGIIRDAVSRTDDHYRLRHRVLHARGQYIWVETIGRLIYGDGSELEEIQCSVRDITDVQKAEERLAESDDRYRRLADNSFEAIFTSENGICTGLNKAAEKMFGYSYEDALGRPSTDCIHPDYHIIVRDHIRSGFEQAYEAVAMRRDGSTFPCEIQARMAQFDGKPIRITAIRDITYRKQAEAERERLRAHMHHLQKLESLGVMAGGVAHDFNNILMTILGNTELARFESPAGAPVVAHLEAIEEAAKKAAKLSAQMLAYSGRGQFVVEDVRLADVVTDVAEILGASISKKATWNIEIPEDLPLFKGDRSQLAQVVTNLVVNASEALGNREGNIEIRAHHSEFDRDMLSSGFQGAPLEPGQYVVFEVADDGNGMEPETLARAFEPFFTNKFTGRGMGLPAVLGILRGHGGAIRVWSEPGEGTVCTLLLPVARDGSSGPVDSDG